MTNRRRRSGAASAGSSLRDPSAPLGMTGAGNILPVTPTFFFQKSAVHYGLFRTIAGHLGPSWAMASCALPKNPYLEKCTAVGRSDPSIFLPGFSSGVSSEVFDVWFLFLIHPPPVRVPM